jgi:tetratricopeptide (TPR) repeat protein
MAEKKKGRGARSARTSRATPSALLVRRLVEAMDLCAVTRGEAQYTMGYRAAKNDPDDGELHFGLATVYRRQRKTDEAIAEYEVAVQKNPKLAKAYYDLRLLYSQDKKNAEARAAFEKYLQYGVNEDAASRKDACGAPMHARTNCLASADDGVRRARM